MQKAPGRSSGLFLFVCLPVFTDSDIAVTLIPGTYSCGTAPDSFHMEATGFPFHSARAETSTTTKMTVLKKPGLNTYAILWINRPGRVADRWPRTGEIIEADPKALFCCRIRPDRGGGIPVCFVSRVILLFPSYHPSTQISQHNLAQFFPAGCRDSLPAPGTGWPSEALRRGPRRHRSPGCAWPYPW